MTLLENTVAAVKDVAKVSRTIASYATRPVAVLGESYATAAYLATTDNKAAAIAVGSAALAATASYIAGTWPFRGNKERVYVPTRWITRHRGPTLRRGPTTNWFVWPIISLVKDDEGIPRAVTGEVEEETCPIKGRSIDGLEFAAKAQYLWELPTTKRAGDFFWNYGNDPAKTREIVQGELSTTLGSIQGRFVAAGRYIAADGTEHDYREEAEARANTRLENEGIGPEVRNFALLNIDFTPRSQAILDKEVDAREERKATVEKALATNQAVNQYEAAAQKIKDKGSNREQGDIMLDLMDLDNNQEVADSKGRIIKVARGLFGG